MLNSNVVKINLKTKQYDEDDDECYAIFYCKGNVVSAKIFECNEPDEIINFTVKPFVQSEDYIVIRYKDTPKTVRHYVEIIEVEHTAETKEEEIQKIQNYFNK